MIELLALILGFSPIGGFSLGLGVFTTPDILPFLVVGYALRNAKISLSGWYAPAFFCFLIPLIFSFVAPPYIPLNETFIISFCALTICAGNLNSQFFKGLTVGASLHLILLLASLLGYPIASEESFWSGQSRFGGLMSDPNAAGLVFLLFLGINELRYFSVLGIFTGSRSYLLGLLFSLKLKIALYLLVFSISLLLLIPAEFLPSSFSRLLSGGLEDRFLFWWASLIDFAGSPFVGIGPDGFRQNVRLNHYQFFGDWIDNPNNYYLLILSEWGVAGFFIFILTIHRFINTGAEIQRIVYVFLGLLMLGSHLLSLEVALVFAALLKPGQKQLKKDYFGIFFGVIFAFLLWFSDRGLYPWEKDGEGYFRWTKERATFNIRCFDDIASLKIENDAKIVSRNQVFSGADIKIPCGSRSKVQVTLTALKPFIPQNDPRVLGSKLRYESP